jgi:uncharacterized protein YacL
MVARVLRLLPLVLLIVFAALYQSQTGSIDVQMLGLITIAGACLWIGIPLLASLLSPITLFNVLLSTLVGLGASVFVLLCLEKLFLDAATTASTLSATRLLLPFSMAIISFHALKAFAFFNEYSLRQGNGFSESTGIRKLIPDQSALEDGRIIDLARTGLFDGQIIVPTFLPAELRVLAESNDETTRTKARRALEVLRKLESMPRVGLQSKDLPIPDSGELHGKILQCAKTLHASLLTNEMPSCRSDADQDMYLAVDTIASALRPPIPKGEVLSIKIQRLGKEPKQGIGYLEDGTMVIVNGGGDYLGRSVRTQVLSQKYSSSGKIIFCNVREEDGDERYLSVPYSHAETNYYPPQSYAQSVREELE